MQLMIYSNCASWWNMHLSFNQRQKKKKNGEHVNNAIKFFYLLNAQRMSVVENKLEFKTFLWESLKLAVAVIIIIQVIKKILSWWVSNSRSRGCKTAVECMLRNSLARFVQPSTCNSFILSLFSCQHQARRRHVTYEIKSVAILPLMQWLEWQPRKLGMFSLILF